MREIRGHGGNHRGKLGIQRTSSASKLSIPDMAGTRPEPACNYTNVSRSPSN